MSIIATYRRKLEKYKLSLEKVAEILKSEIATRKCHQLIKVIM